MSVAPRATCRLWFTPGNSVHPATVMPIRGINTPVIGVTISVEASQQAGLSVSGSPLALITNGPAGSLTITNTSAVTTATNITSNFAGTALNGNVNETGNTCATVAPGASCTLTYTPGATPVPQTTFTISGNNTAVVNAAMSITSTVAVGDAFGGGIVACLGGAPYQNLIVATTDNSSSAEWWSDLTVVTGAQESDNGAQNTQRL